ncbi:uncharacterized protein LAESUDRAFT_706306 [Laetiporus sulphureus 93-53]|uniref:F-box domain-containing protein n=1 Tax=Laetiporus sulphureus 93-53 TaxID=1314785 RepID=A0A165CBK3_9APHY|nr:uncharacterized protein LAESUDRAFT_706306 [Laetiporus sulphureus 93-53]KZT02512.1 hypothetical protein LAESUDRAFT_706306 [Laetiporus sulphureus 93-53]
MGTSAAEASTILLSPRPLARTAGKFLLLPLLPHRPVMKPLPPEVWSKILAYVFGHYEGAELCKSHRQEREQLRRGLLVVSKELKNVALPLFYEHVCIASLPCLERFTDHVCQSDKKWDSIRRIPYSTPGRWVQDLDMRELETATWCEMYRVDTLLTQLCPLLPFLARLAISPSLTLSRRAATALSYRTEVAYLRVLKGIKLETSAHVSEDHFVELLRPCVNLEELTLIGSGVDATELELPGEPDGAVAVKPLHLPHLRKLVMLSLPCSPVLFALLHSPLPSLRHLTITPYDESFVPMSIVPHFIYAHGETLTSLHLYTTKTWPSMLLPSPTTLLQSCPNLYHLSLENPLPALKMFKDDPPHPLHILSIPRPYPDFLAVHDTILPKLSSLKVVRARDVRWLRPGMSLRAQQAGVQGEMVEWRRRLSRKGIQVLDSEWKSGHEI